MNDKIQISTEYLASMCVNESDIYHGYSDEDLFHATQIFTHFVMDKLSTACKGLPEEEQMTIALNTGGAIRDLINTACKIDMHKVAKKLYDT